MKCLRSNINFLILFLPVLILFVGCSHDPKGQDVPEFSRPDTSIQRQVGERFILSLESNPSTGYSWKFSAPVDGKILRLVKSEYRSPGPQIPGKGGRDSWIFQTIGKGNTSITLVYLRPWEKNTPPAKKAVFRVTVK
jgi:inhibitor of cysteine peptidase